MHCKKYQQWLLLADTGELSASRRKRLMRHIDDCGACRDFLGLWRSVQRHYRPAGAEPGVDAMAKPRCMAAAIRPPRPTTPWLLRIAALLAVLVAGGLVISRWRAPDTDVARPLAAGMPAAEEFADLADMWTEQVMDIQRLEDVKRSGASALDIEIMLLEGLLI